MQVIHFLLFHLRKYNLLKFDLDLSLPFPFLLPFPSLLFFFIYLFFCLFVLRQCLAKLLRLFFNLRFSYWHYRPAPSHWLCSSFCMTTPHLLSWLVCFMLETEWTQGLAHAEQVLYHWTTPPIPPSFFFLFKLLKCSRFQISTFYCFKLHCSHHI